MGSDCFYLSRVSEIGSLLAAMGNIATIGLSCCPGELILLGLWSLEECSGLPESRFDSIRRESMILDIDESGALKARENGLSRSEAFRRITGEEL